MNISSNGLALIEISEGCEKLINGLYFPYKDGAGLWTVGIGHLIKPGENQFNAGLTHDQCLDLLQKDVAWAETCVNKLGWVLTQNQFDALVDFCYNEGVSNLHILTSHGYNNIPDHILLYDEAAGEVEAGLLIRRKKELALWLS